MYSLHHQEILKILIIWQIWADARMLFFLDQEFMNIFLQIVNCSITIQLLFGVSSMLDTVIIYQIYTATIENACLFNEYLSLFYTTAMFLKLIAFILCLFSLLILQGT